MANDRREDRVRPHGEFKDTHWSVVRDAAKIGTPEAHRALQKLCVTYREPVHTFIWWKWSRGDEDAAHDLTQGFFERLLDKNHEVAAVVQDKGKFRNWLLKAVDSYCTNVWKRARAEKRGGGAAHVSLDADERSRPQLTHGLTPERMFERRWALTLLDRALCVLRDEYAVRDDLPAFKTLKLCLGGWDDYKPAEMARDMGIERANTLSVQVSRFKSRFRARLRDEIAQTVGSEAEIEAELAYLQAALQPR
jgi:DNA-directed RNA polymerase specialized sigma24 family protein